MKNMLLACFSLFAFTGCVKEVLPPDLPATESMVYAYSTAPATAGNIIHVPADYATIQGAIDAATDGTKILVAAGTYNEGLILIDGLDGLSLGTETGAVVNGRFLIQNCSDLLLAGFTINSTLTDVDERLIEVKTSCGPNVRIVRNQFHFPFATDFLKRGITFFADDGFIADNHFVISDASFQHAAIVSYGSYTLIKGNRVEYLNIDPSITWNRGISVSLGIQNTIFRNQVTGALIGIASDASDEVTIEANMTNDNGQYGIYSSYSCDNVIVGNTALGNGVCDIQFNGNTCGTIEADNTADCIMGL